MPQGQPGQPSQPPNYMNLGLKKVATTKSVVIFDIVSHDYILQGAIAFDQILWALQRTVKVIVDFDQKDLEFELNLECIV